MRVPLHTGGKLRFPEIEYGEPVAGSEFSEDLEVKFLIEIARVSIAKTARVCGIPYSRLRGAINGTLRNELSMKDRETVINYLKRKAKE